MFFSPHNFYLLLSLSPLQTFQQPLPVYTFPSGEQPMLLASELQRRKGLWKDQGVAEDGRLIYIYCINVFH